MSKIRTCLWFHDGAETAAQFYSSVIPRSQIETIVPGPNGGALMVDLLLDGVPYCLLNGGPHFTLSPAASIQVFTEDQAETDALWAALTEGGQESRCAWCVDSFGVSWQVIPRVLPQLVGGSDPEGARRATEAMMGMAKIDIAALQAAYDGTA